MRTKSRIMLARIVAIVLLASCAAPAPPPPKTEPAPAAPAARPASDLVDHEGDSTDTAVVVPKDTQDEARFENDWIFDRIGRFRRVSQGTGTLNGRRYDVIDVETPAGDKKKFYFDITDHWNNWKPPQ